MTIEMRGISKSYGDVQAVRNLDLSIGDGEFVVLLGPSGCGKTTTMRLIVGLETADAGSISIGGRAVYNAATKLNVPTHRRNVGMVFQSYAIWPHRSVHENVAYPLKVKKYSSSHIADKVRATLELVGLEHLGDRSASKLSGGQMQRVALARSLAMEPSVLLLDEPLSNLDAKLRDRLRLELRRLQQRLDITTVYVTHDQSEALALADRIAVMKDGVIEQSGRPVDLYRSPVSTFVADFLGVSNIFPANPKRDNGALVADIPMLSVALPIDPARLSDTDTPFHIGIRPEEITVLPKGSQAPNGSSVAIDRPCKVVVAGFLGATVAYEIEIEGAASLLDVIASGKGELLSEGADVDIYLNPSSIQVLPR